MAKHINSVTVPQADGSEIVVTKTSTHRSYVAASCVRNADGSVDVVSWHLTEEAARKNITGRAFTYFLSEPGASAVILPVSVEIKLSRKELAALEAEAEVVEEAPVEVEVVEAPVVEVVEDEAPSAAEVAETAAVEAPVKFGMGVHTAGDVVTSKDGLEWTVVGPAEAGRTVKVTRVDADGNTKTRLSYHYNLTAS